MSPVVLLVAGPNGAGKSTLAPSLLPERLGIRDYVNADAIAQGLSAFAPELQAIRAGRIMLQRMRELARNRASFAFETTLSSRSYAPWLRNLRHDGYQAQIVYLWLRSADLAVARVAERVRQGGHAVPEDVVRRRFQRGLVNFLELYSDVADRWRVLDTSSRGPPVLVATGGAGLSVDAVAPELWQAFRERAHE